MPMLSCRPHLLRPVQRDVSARQTLVVAAKSNGKSKPTPQRRTSLPDTNTNEIAWVAKLACETRTLHHLELDPEEQAALETRCLLSNVAYGVQQQAKVLEEARLLLTDTHARLDLMQASCCSQEDAVRAWLAAADASLSTPADVVAGDVEAVAA